VIQASIRKTQGNQASVTHFILNLCSCGNDSSQRIKGRMLVDCTNSVNSTTPNHHPQKLALSPRKMAS
jgi:hypothetical protein